MHFIETLVKTTGEYLDTKVELTKLKAISSSSDVLSTMIYWIIKILIIFLFIGFVSIAAAVLISNTLGEYYYGFLIVGGFYLIVLLVIYIQRKKWIKGPVANGLVSKMLK